MALYIDSIDKFAAKNLTDEQISNFTDFRKLLESKSYVPFNDPLLSHILFCTQLSDLEKLLYLTSYSLGYINLSNIDHRQVAMSGKKLGEIICCSKSQVLTTQKSLSDKGYLTVMRQKNKFGQNNRNLLSPTLPNEVFSRLSITPNKKGVYLPFDSKEETPLSYLERTKQYIPLNYQIFRIVASNINLTSKQKVLWIGFFIQAYKNFTLNKDDSINCLSFTSSYLELASKLGCSVKTISDVINVLVKERFLQKQKFYVKNGSELQDRCDKSLWSITISLPEEYRQKIKAIENRKGYVKKIKNPCTLEADRVNNRESTPNSDPDYPQFRPHINKDFKLNKDRSSERADFFKIEKEEEKKEQINIKIQIKEAVTQKVTKNQVQSKMSESISSSAPEKSACKPYKSQRKSLSELEPITEEEAIVLKNSSGRDFSCNYMNKLIQRLAKLFPGHGFYTRKLFLSYMSKTLSLELRETTKANNADFTFKANEKVIAQEKYLEEIETNYDTSTQAQLKKKIAGRFDGPLAYQILTSCDFQGAIAINKGVKERETENKQNQKKGNEPQHDDVDFYGNAKDFKAFNDHEISEDFNASYNQQQTQNQSFIISLSKPLNLKEHEQEMLLEQVKAVYGNKIKNLEFKQNFCIVSNKTRDAYFDKLKDERSLTNEALLEAVPGSVWYKISQNLIAKYGIYLYKAWFGKSKTEAIIDEQNKTLSLKASTGFIASYVESNYFMDLRALSSQESYSLEKIWA